MRRTRPGAVLLTGLLALGATGGLIAGSAGRAGAAVDPNTVIVQGGTTPTDTGLLQAVIEPGFKAAYPQYTLKYVSVGTGQAVTNVEAGQGDALLTHSPALEDTFVSQGYSYEPGGRLAFTSDFVTVGPGADPAGVKTGPAADVVAAYREIAAAGNAGKADFVSRGDKSGTNTKEISIWALTGIPLNTLGEPGTPGTKTDAAWYHKTGRGQSDNLVLTDQCPFSSGACYTFSDTGTFNNVLATGAVTHLVAVSQNNTAPTALGGVNLLTNPYHVYAVNPAKEPNVNLPGALAFINYITSASAQAAIGNFPKPSAPAFVPDAFPAVTVGGLPRTAIVANSPVTLSGTVRPRFTLDPQLDGATVQLLREGDAATVLATTRVEFDGTYVLSFRPTRGGIYDLFIPQSKDFLVEPTDTSVRQPETVRVGSLDVRGSASIRLAAHQPGTIAAPGTVRFSGTALGGSGRKAPGITVQIRKGGGAFHNASKLLRLGRGVTTWTIAVKLPSAGTWQARAVYTDPGVVGAGYSHTQTAHVA